MTTTDPTTIAPKGRFLTKLTQLKEGAPLIAATAALLTSIAAFRKPSDPAPTRVAYEQLAGDIRTLSKQVEQNHDDVETLKSYLRGKGVLAEVSLLSPPASAMVPVVDAGVTVALASPPPVTAPSRPRERDLPAPSPKPKAVNPPAFSQLDIK